jgi:hypothetical protein
MQFYLIIIKNLIIKKINRKVINLILNHKIKHINNVFII